MDCTPNHPEKPLSRHGLASPTWPGYTDPNGAEDRATQGCDLSADSAAGMAATGTPRRPTLLRPWAAPTNGRRTKVQAGSIQSVHSRHKALNPRGFGGGSPNLTKLPSELHAAASLYALGQIDGSRRLILQALMQALVIVEPQVTADPRAGVRHRRVVPQVHFLILQ